jgi:O-antigen/teichoic acid export membrane protein
MSDARRLAKGSLAQQAAQVTGLLAMFLVITVLARQLTLAELGVYGLLNALAGYLLIVQNAAAGSAVRAMAATRDERAGSEAFTTAALLYVGAGALAGLVIAGLGVALAAAIDLPPELARQARLGAVAVGVVTLVGWPLTVYRDALRARGRFVLAAKTEIAASLVYVTILLALAFADAPLWTILAAGAAIPLLAGLGCMAVATVVRVPWQLRRRYASSATARDLLGIAGYISLAEAASAAVYVIGRTLLGVFKSPDAVGLLEGPIRVHNLIRALNAAVTVVVLPTASGYHAAGDEQRLRELLLRGSRYTLALIVPIAVTGMVLAEPILDAWLGSDFAAADVALTILLSHWLLSGMSGVAAALLVGVGRARDLARWAVAVAGTSVALMLALTPWLGIDGVALATALPYVALFPYLIAITLRRVSVTASELVRNAFLPAWALGAALAAVLVAARIALDPDGAIGVAITAGLGLAAYWLGYYVLVLTADERRLVRDVLS